MDLGNDWGGNAPAVLSHHPADGIKRLLVLK